MRHVLDTIPNIVAIKSEQGFPSTPAGVSALNLQFSGTSNTNWMSDYYSATFQLARNGRWEEAMERFWSVHPARLAAGAAAQSYAGGTGVLNRTMWKYAGYNGGPLRAPGMRVPDRFMKSRAGLQASGLPVTSDPDSEFMVGRNPA